METKNDCYAEGLAEGIRLGYAMGVDAERKALNAPHVRVQKLMAGVLAVLTLILVIAAQELSIAIVTVPVCMYLSTTREQWVDDSFVDAVNGFLNRLHRIFHRRNRRAKKNRNRVSYTKKGETL